MNIGVQSWISDNMLKSKTAKGQQWICWKKSRSPESSSILPRKVDRALVSKRDNSCCLLIVKAHFEGPTVGRGA